MPDRFNLVKRGYDPVAVDQYIDKLEIELRGHRDKGSIINHAIVSAQQAADNIILNAKSQGHYIRESTAKQLEDITLSIAGQRQLLNEFVREYNSVVSKYLTPMDNQDFKTASAKIDALEAFLHSFSEEVDEDLQVVKRRTEAFEEE